MKLFQRILFAAVLSGIVAGIGMSGLQQWRVAPLLVEAEMYEGAASEAAVADEHDAAASAQEHDEAAWAPQDGAERIAFTVLADLLASVGFALLLGAVSVLSGMEVTTRNGVLWGLAGFATFQLAPALGLPPELPGMPAADLVARQVWWWGCALATATAIFGVARFRTWPAVAIGIVLILLPHLIGAPKPDGALDSGVPPHLAAEFAAGTLFIGAALWLALGPLYGFVLERLSRRAAAGETVAA